MSNTQEPEKTTNAPSSDSETTYAVSHPTGATDTLSPPEQAEPSAQLKEEQRIQEDIPWGVRIAAAWSWRIIIILIAAGVGVWLMGYLMLLLIPLMIAALLTTLLRPLHNLFVAIKIPRVLAAMTSIVVFLGVVFAILYFVGNQLVQGFAEMADQVETGVYELIDWADETLQGFGFEVSADEFNQALDEVIGWIQDNQQAIMSSAGAFGSAVTNFTVGTILVLFTLIFFLSDGPKLWDFMTFFAPAKHRPAIHGAGRRGWTAVSTYMRVQVFVAFVDAVGIYLGAVILEVPLAVPIAVLVFFGGFVPIVGAVVTGAIAVLLAWVAHDFVTALIMLGVVLAVQQLESNVLQPIVMGKAVKLHPLAVVLAVTAGTTLMGIPGALFAVPVLAFISRSAKYLVREEWRGDQAALDMERTLKEETFRREAQREINEAEEEQSLATLRERFKQTLPGLSPNRAQSERAKAAGTRKATDGDTEQESVEVPAPKPATEDDDDVQNSGKDTNQ